MCLDVEVEGELLDSGTRRARKEHRCDECKRAIEPGETYRFWTVKDWDSSGVGTSKMCAHCYATIELGAALTGCPKCWFWDMVHDLDPENGGFVGDIIVNHTLPKPAHLAMLRTVIGRRKGWRRKDGTLLPLPKVPAVAA